jgi:3-mercaptopyruvate sulfurtransferase SseA
MAEKDISVTESLAFGDHRQHPLRRCNRQSQRAGVSARSSASNGPTRASKRDDLLVIDASPGKLRGRSIPGAVNVDVFTFGGRQLSAAEMEKLIQSWGVSSGKKIVLYDQGGTFFATSLFFDLYYHGVPAANLAVLDGGLAKWQAANGAVTKDATPAPKPGTFRVAKLREDVRVRLSAFLVASGDPANSALVEALEPGQHYGAAKFCDRAGHVPNAILSPVADYYNADKTFKSPEEIRRMLTYLGVKPEQQVYSHCGGGLAAAVPFFAAKFMLDYPKVKLVLNRPQMFTSIGHRPRTVQWIRLGAQHDAREGRLSGWNNQMLRMFGVSKLSLVDVRPAASFKQSPCRSPSTSPRTSSSRTSQRPRSSPKFSVRPASTRITKR